MKMVSIQDLKRNLSSLVRQTAAGERILVTRHGRPLAELAPPSLQHVHVGSHFGRRKLEPVLQRGSRGGYLAILSRDRRDAR